MLQKLHNAMCMTVTEHCYKIESEVKPVH